MNQKRKNTSISASRLSRVEKKGAALASDLCECLPLTSDPACDEAELILISPELSRKLSILLDKFFGCKEPFSIFVFHLSQLEPTPLAPESDLLYHRHHYHAPGGLLDQVLAHMRRVIRYDDTLLISENAGAAIVFPGVDQQGAYAIADRVYRSIELLQAETMEPPLTRETCLTLGIGFYPSSTASEAQLYLQAGRVARRLTWRPALKKLVRGVKPLQSVNLSRVTDCAVPTRATVHKEVSGSPFMELPKILPARLTQYIPLSVARELACAPVGCDHQYLTVAMVDPTNVEALQRLQALTGMTIFPVSCEPEALNTLLFHGW